MATSSGDAYLAENHQPRLYGAFISTYLLAVIAVCLRLSARKRFSKAGLWLDDYAICAALGVATGYFIDMIICKTIIKSFRSTRKPAQSRCQGFSGDMGGISISMDQNVSSVSSTSTSASSSARSSFPSYSVSRSSQSYSSICASSARRKFGSRL